MTPEPKLSLFQIESELVGLVALRQEMLESSEDTAAIDAQIQAYLKEQLPAKVDGIRGYIRSLEAGIAAAKEEQARVTAYRKSMEAQLGYMTDYVRDAMSIGGKNKLEGRTGYLSLRNAGGMQALTIPHPGLIPEDLVIYRGWMSPTAFESIPEKIRGRQDFQFEREPKNEAIRAELEKPCEVCGGAGTWDGLPAGISEYRPEGPCRSCNGTGKRRVPGARLELRSVSLVVK